MRIVITMLLLLTCNLVNASSTYWSGIRLINDGVYSDNLGEYGFLGVVRNDGGKSAEIISSFYAHGENGKIYIKHADFSKEQIEPTFNWWALALYGDIASETTFNPDSLNRIEDFYGDDSGRYTGGTLVENPDDFYMAFKVSEVLLDENYDYYEGQTWYGWVHVSIDENLEMSLLGDGINLYGGAVTVGEGASPEPASGLLLLVGGALLALRRRKNLL